MILSNKLYDWAKWFVYIFLPAFGTFYVTLGNLWGLPAGEQVAGTCLALGTFLGITLKVSEKNWVASDASVAGDILLVDQDGPNPNTVLAFNEDPGTLTPGQRITLKVSEFNSKDE